MRTDCNFTDIFLSHFIENFQTDNTTEYFSDNSKLSVNNSEVMIEGTDNIINFLESGTYFNPEQPLSVCTKNTINISETMKNISVCFRQDKMYYVSCLVNMEINKVLSVHICTFVDKTKRKISYLDTADMNYVLNNMFYAVYIVNLYNYTLDAVRVPKRHINYINKFNNYMQVMQILVKDFVHPDDCQKMLQFGNPEVILNFFKSGKHHLVNSFRRNIADDEVWVNVHIMPLQNFSSENPRVFIGFESSDRKRIDEFEQSFNDMAISNMYTLILSVDTNLEYYNCIHYSEYILNLDKFGFFKNFINQLMEYMYDEDKLQLKMLISSLKNIDKDDRIESEFRLLDKNGILHYYIYCITRNLSIDGDKFVLFVQNIDYQKHIELEKEKLNNERLRSQNIINALSETYSAIISANIISDSYYVVRSEYDFDYIYKNCIKFTDAIKLYIKNYIHPDERDYIYKFVDLTTVYRNLPPDKKSFEIEFRRKLNDFEGYEWVRSEVWFTSKTENGAPKEIIFTVKNIDNEKKEESETRYMSAVFGNSIVESFDFIYEVDSITKEIKRISYEQNKIIHTSVGIGDLFINETAEKYIFGKHKKTFLNYMSMESLAKNLNSENPQQYFEIKRKVNDEYLWFSYTCRFMDIHNRRFILILLKNINSIREQEEKSKQLLSAALQEAQIANEAKSDFLTNMSHDIRTPMNAIVGMTTIAAAYIDDKERIKDCLSKITISSKHLLNLINDILDMSKIENGKITLNTDEFNLADLIHNFIAIVRPEIEKKSLKLDVITSDVKHENLIGDILRLQQVFINITGNAIKFTAPGGKITIIIYELESDTAGYAKYKLKFIDTGIGMSEKFINRIFQPFERAHTSTISRTEGTGLGMAITKSILDLMDGEISVESTEGQGTTFTVLLPIKVQDKEITVSEKIKDKNILLFSEDTGIIENAKKIFDDYGISHDFALSSSEAIEKLSKEKFDLFITDWEAKDNESRVNLARKINSFSQPIPIIPLSYLEKYTIENSIGKPVAAFIQRPLFRTKLLSALLDSINGVVPAPTGSTQNSMSNIPDYSGKRVLLVEDNEFNVEIAKELLSMSNMEIDYAKDGSVAVEKMFEAEENRYDLILMDIQMPEMDGYEATEIIRNMDREDIKTIPIIALTANAFAEDIQKAKKFGMNSHISKPIDIKNLYRVLGNFL